MQVRTKGMGGTRTMRTTRLLRRWAGGRMAAAMPLLSPGTADAATGHRRSSGGAHRIHGTQNNVGPGPGLVNDSIDGCWEAPGK